MKLIDFYRNECPTNGGYYLEEIMQWVRGHWEASHEEIQWVFPTKQISQFNSEAPLLTDDAIALFKADPELMENYIILSG